MTASRTRAQRQARQLPLLRNSERQSFLACRWRWRHEYLLRLRPRQDKPALRFGTLIHQALAAYYLKGLRRGPHPARTFEKLYDEQLARAEVEFGTRIDYDEESEGRWVKARDLGVNMLENYIRTYGKDAEWEVLVTEQPFQVVVPRRTCAICDERIFWMAGGRKDEKMVGLCSDQCPGPKLTPWFKFVGVLDGVWRHRHTKKVVIPDHKTAASIRLDYLRLDEQCNSYWTFGVPWLYERGLLPKDMVLDGMLYNFMRKSMFDERPQDEKGRRLNKDGTISKKQPPPYFVRQPMIRNGADRAVAYDRALRHFEEMERVRADLDLAFKSPSQFHCNGCWLIDMCEIDEMGQEYSEMIPGTTRKWDPYAEHEIYERS